MKNMKKLFTSIIAMVMLLCAMTVMASAAEEGTKPVTVLDITKKVSGIKGDKGPKETFTFNVTPADVKDGAEEGGVPVYPGKDLGKKEIAFDGTEEVAEDGTVTKNTTEDFSKVTFDKTGIYRYEVTEEKGTTPGMTYDEKKYVVDVYVGEDEDGNLVVKSVVSKVPGNNAKEPIEFENKLATESLTVTKTVTGDLGDKKKEFNFTLTITGCDALPSGANVPATITKGDATQNVTVTVGKAYAFKLADGDKLEVTGLPQGVGYIVTEVDADADGYTTTIEDENKGKIVEGGNTVTVINDKSMNAPTGIALKVAPYAVIVLLAFAAFGLMIARKRNAYED